MTDQPYTHWQTGRPYQVEVVFVPEPIPYKTLRMPHGARRWYLTRRVYLDQPEED